MSADGQRLAEIDDDEVSVYDGRRLASRFREIEVEVAEEAPVELLPGVIERLHAGGAGAIDPTPKVVRALGARALAEPEVVVPSLGPGATAGDAVRRAIAASVVRLMRHDPIARLGTDPEGVHQARVATRRLRSDLRTFRPLLDTEWSEPLRDELRWLGGELGAVRDAEVLRDLLRDTAADHLPEADLAAAAEIAEALAESVHNARQHLLASMRTRRYAVLLDRLVAAAASPGLLAAANAPARSVVPRLVASPWSSLKKAARGLDEESPAEELHDLRIRAKRCRYAAEAVAPVVGRRAAAFAREVAALQQVLGDFHDAIVAEAWLREYVSSRQPDARIAFVAGELCGVEQATAKSLRSAWPAVWKRASRKENRTWM
jgi:CHAD domain-containing protein